MRPSLLPRLAALLALLLAASACNFGLARSGSPPPSTSPLPPKKYGAGLKFSPPPTYGKGKGELIIYVLEEGTNRPIPGAHVRYEGPEKGTVVTNADGRALAKVKPGVYKASLPPCGERVMITTYREADVGVVPNGKAGGQLHTTWEHRFVPTPSVRASKEPPWSRSDRVELGVRIEDRCDFSDAPRASLDGTHGWSLSDNFAFVSTPPLRAGSDGFITVTIRCTRSGNGEIVIFDRYDPEDKVDLLLAMSAPPPGESYCR